MEGRGPKINLFLPNLIPEVVHFRHKERQRRTDSIFCHGNEFQRAFLRFINQLENFSSPIFSQDLRALTPIRMEKLSLGGKFSSQGGKFSAQGKFFPSKWGALKSHWKGREARDKLLAKGPDSARVQKRLNYAQQQLTYIS